MHQDLPIFFAEIPASAMCVKKKALKGKNDFRFELK
jgi:hypothetical protein